MQQTVEDLLSRVHGRNVILGGCGRTDAGVHATQFYAYLRTEEPLPDNYLFFVNKQLPRDIALRDVHSVPDNAQARFDATERTYDYLLHGSPDAWLDRGSGQFDLTSFAPARVAQVLPLLLTHEDYRALCKAPDRHNTTLVHFRQATLFRNGAGDRYRFRFVANRFLRGMIRLLVHHLFQVGTGRLSAEDFTRVLQTQTRSEHFRLAPPEGLYLTGVRYPYLDREARLPPIGEVKWIPIP